MQQVLHIMQQVLHIMQQVLHIVPQVMHIVPRVMHIVPRVMHIVPWVLVTHQWRLAILPRQMALLQQVWLHVQGAAGPSPLGSTTVAHRRAVSPYNYRVIDPPPIIGRDGGHLQESAARSLHFPYNRRLVREELMRRFPNYPVLVCDSLLTARQSCGNL